MHITCSKNIEKIDKQMQNIAYWQIEFSSFYQHNIYTKLYNIRTAHFRVWYWKVQDRNKLIVLSVNLICFIVAFGKRRSQDTVTEEENYLKE